MEPPSSLTIVFLCLGISLILLLVCSALISGSEVAFFSLSPKQIDSLKKSKDKNSVRVLRLLGNPDYLLGSILQVNNLVNIIIVLLSTILLSLVFDFEGHPVIEFLVSTIIVTFILVLFGEVMPKIMATHAPVRFAKFMSIPIIFLSPITKPFNYLMSRFASKVTHNIPLRGEITLKELSDAVDIATTSASAEKMILKGIVNLPTTDVRKIMKPRVDVVALDINLNNEDVIKIATNCGFSRLPVYDEDLDDIKGFLYIKDMLPYLLKFNKEKFSWREHIREAYYVPESKKINDLLEEFRNKKMHLAVVVDEYGGTDGIVTLEDILEEIVGEIVDESDFNELTELNKINK
ncbi:MAG: CNNM domain-containing protein [Bacteroidales bacterium]